MGAQRDGGGVGRGAGQAVAFALFKLDGLGPAGDFLPLPANVGDGLAVDEPTAEGVAAVGLAFEQAIGGV